MAGSPPNFHKIDSRSACIQGVLKVKIKVKGQALSWILGMSYSVIDGLVKVSVADLRGIRLVIYRSLIGAMSTATKSRPTGIKRHKLHAAVSLRICVDQNLQQHRAVSLRQHGFLVISLL